MTVDGVAPGRVERPATVDDVRRVVREGKPLVACGLGAHLDIGASPARLEVLVRLDALDRVVDHQAADMTVTVEAGCPLPALARTLAAAGQWLPLDPPRVAATTVGGLVAANLSGPLRASQGTVRDLLIGIRVVGAGGDVVTGGGKVVKNVAGYDLPKLHVGALGTLGVIVEATFKVRPRPAREEAVVIACRSAEEAADVALAACDAAVPPLWLEVGGAGALSDGPAATVVGLGGTVEEVAHGRALLLRTRGAVAVDDAATLRARLADFAVEPAAAMLRIATLPADVGALVADAERGGRAAGTAVRTLTHAASGVVRVAVAEANAVPRLLNRLRERAAVVVERASPAVKATVDVWGDPGPGAALMRGVKDAFDPARIFAPGRFVAGL